MSLLAGSAAAAPNSNDDFPSRIRDSVQSALWAVSKPNFGSANRRTVYAHRGASGYRPEHTRSAYLLAIGQGADVIEPDLVMTKDGQLVDRHENEISGTTDVAKHPEFASRKTTKVIDGARVTGWFTEDFTLAELKTLRAIERLPAIRPQNTAFDGQDEILTLDEVLDIARKQTFKVGRVIAVAPEIKHSTYFHSIGQDPEAALLKTLRRRGLTTRRSPVIVQSFEISNLKRLSRESNVPTVQLIDTSGQPADVVAEGGSTTYAEMTTPAGLKQISSYADAVSPNVAWTLPRDSSGKSLAPTSFVNDAHAQGLPVVVWTFRRENTFLPLERRVGADPAGIGDLKGYIKQILELGVDAVFTDNPDVAVAARREFNSGR